jgi:hypothetical protein
MVIAFFSYIIYKSIEQTEKKEEEEKTDNDFSVQISVDGGEFKNSNLQSSMEERKDWEKRRKLLYAKDARRKWKNQVWAILRYIVTYRTLLDSTNFYNYKKNWDDHKQAIGTMKKMQPDDYCLNVAFRFCQMENYYGTCSHALTNEDIKYVRNWKDNNLTIEDILHIVTESYKTYWNNVLNSYVRPSARTKRLQYLVDDFEEIMALPDIQDHPKIIEQIKDLQSSYLSQSG